MTHEQARTCIARELSEYEMLKSVCGLEAPEFEVVYDQIGIGEITFQNCRCPAETLFWAVLEAKQLINAGVEVIFRDQYSSLRFELLGRGVPITVITILRAYKKLDELIEQYKACTIFI